LFRGQASADADYLLDIARRVESYGIRTYPAVDPEHTEISLAVTHMGVVVLRVGFELINVLK